MYTIMSKLGSIKPFFFFTFPSGWIKAKKVAAERDLPPKRQDGMPFNL